ncbi:MAG: hypothetical protein J6A56_05980 [Clostridia bacterium]|nr:hypothetical protein [Clostridia bacterium]
MIQKKRKWEETMREKNSKRVVIIDDIDSGSIEQAIFILRNSGIPNRSAGNSIVSEAERIIHAYVQTMERTQKGISKREERSRRRKKQRSWRGIASVGIALGCFAVAAGLLFHYMGSILSGF